MLTCLLYNRINYC